MKPTHWVLALFAASSFFAGGYVLGQSTATVVPELHKQPASMLSLGVVSANGVLQPTRTVLVRGDRLVVRRTWNPNTDIAKAPAVQCATELDQDREYLGAKKTASGRSRSALSLHFVSAIERGTDTRSVQERRDAVDAATIVRIEFAAGGGCEGSLLGSDARTF